MGRSRGLSTVATAYDGGSLGYRNLIINGAMQIAQKGTSATGITSGSATRSVDRFKTVISSLGTWTVEQSTDAPDGFATSLKHSCTTADASPAAGDYLFIDTRLEGQQVQHLAKGTTSAKKVTLSFWVKCNKTGNMQVNLRDHDNSRQISSVVSISSADTWEKKTITFDGDTTGAFDNDNNESLRIEWYLDSGTTYSSGSVPTAWEAISNADRNAGGTLALADSTSNYINITGVQLEVGDAATDFEHRPYTTELALCQRYYQKSFRLDVAPANAVSYSGQAHSGGLFCYSTSQAYGEMIQFKVNMRAIPTITPYSSSLSGNVDGKWHVYNGSWVAASSTYANLVSPYNFNMFLGGSYTQFDARLCIGHWTAEAEL